MIGGRDTGATRSADLHVVRLDGQRLGWPQWQGRLERDREHLRCRRGGAAVRGAGAPHPGDHERALDPRRLGWDQGTLPRRLRRAEGRHPDRCEADGHVVLLRPRTVDRHGASRAACRRSRRASGCGPTTRRSRFLGAIFSRRSSRGRATLFIACLGRWRRIRRPARAATRSASAKMSGRAMSPLRARTARLRRRRCVSSTPTSACTRSTRRAPPASERYSARDSNRLARGGRGGRRCPLSLRRADDARPCPPVRRHPRLGRGISSAADDRAVSGHRHDAAPRRTGRRPLRGDVRLTRAARECDAHDSWRSGPLARGV